MNPETIDNLWFAFAMMSSMLGGFVVGFIVGEGRRHSRHLQKQGELCPHGRDWDYCPVCCH